jgi:hypothetical protein
VSRYSSSVIRVTVTDSLIPPISGPVALEATGRSYKFCVTQTEKSSDVENCPFYRSAGIRPLLRPLAWHSPYLFWPVALVRHNRNLSDDRFDVMVDGYQRSANTYLATALQLAAKPEIRIWTHFHSPAAVIAALNFGKPTIVLVRRPRDAIAAWTAMSRYPIAYTLPCYVDYYKKLLDYIDVPLFIKFEDVTSDVNGVLAIIGDRFPRIMQHVAPPADFPHLIFKQIENQFVESHGTIDEQRISRPSIERADATVRVTADLGSKLWRNHLYEAESIYDKIVTAICSNTRQRVYRAI